MSPVTSNAGKLTKNQIDGLRANPDVKAIYEDGSVKPAAIQFALFPRSDSSITATSVSGLMPLGDFHA